MSKACTLLRESFFKNIIMEWESKVELIQLGNQAHDSYTNKKKYHDYVLSKIDSFDGQTIDMFIQNTSIIPDEINDDREFYQTVYDKIIKIIDNFDNIERLTLRCTLRLSYLDLILKGEMK